MQRGGPSRDTIDFIWHQAELRLEAQMRRAEALDTKAGLLIGVHAVAAGLFASIAPRLEGGGRSMASAVIGGLLVSGWFAFRAFKAQEYARHPSPHEMWVFAEWRQDDIRHRFLSTRLEALDHNAWKLRAKARWVAASMTTLAVVASFVAIASVWSLIT